MKHYRKLALILIAGTSLYSIKKFCHAQTDGFQVVKIISDISFSKEWEIPSLDSAESGKLQSIFSQPFHYLDCGGQSYAFLSQDGKIVLKFFKMHHLRQYPWLYKVALPPFLDKFKWMALLYQKQRLERVFSSCKIAYSELKDETGLLYMNLNTNAELKTLHVKLIDKIGIAHELSLSNIPFVLQYKADNAFKTLRAHLKKQDLRAAKNVVKEIVNFLALRHQKGIKDLDPAPRRNIGLVETQAIAIDIGSFYHIEKPISEEEVKLGLIQDTRRMRKWLEKRSKELTDYFDAIIADY